MTLIQALNSIANFQAFFSQPSTYLLIQESRYYSQHSEALINMILSHPEEIKRLTRGEPSEFTKLIQAFPGRAQEIQIQVTNIIQTALNTIENFQAFFPSHTNSLDKLIEIASQFPPYAEALIEFVLSHSGEIERLTGGQLYELKKLILAFPERAQELEILVDNRVQIILSTIENFQNYFAFPHLYVLIEVASEFPRHAEALIEFVLLHPEELERLTHGHLDMLNQLRPAFSACTILQKQSVREVKDALYIEISTREIKKNVIALHQIRPSFPDELVVYIAAMTGSKNHSDKEINTAIACKQNWQFNKNAALINQHRLLNGLINNPKKTSEQQYEFDKRFGLTIYSGSETIL